MTVPVSAAGAAAGNQTGGQQGGQQQENQSGAGGNDGQQQGGSLLDDEANDEHQQEQGGGQQQGAGDGGQQQGTPLTAEAVAELFERGFDRRINAVLREVRGSANGQRQDDQQNGGQQVQQGQTQQQSAPAGPTASTIREARGVYREYVADEIRFLGNEERDLATSIATGMLQQRLAAGEDPEAAGSAVAKDVAKQIKNARRLYEDRTVSALKRRGLLPDDAGRPGQPTPGPNKPGAQSGYAAGASVASTMFANRMPQTQQ